MISVFCLYFKPSFASGLANWYYQNMKIKNLRIIWITALGVIILALIVLAIAPFGYISYRTDLLRPDYFIGSLTPTDRLAGKEGEAARRILAEPVYFSLYTPRPFNNVRVTLEYSSKAPLIELGLRRDGVAWNFERQPIYFQVLEDLARNPNTIQEDGVLLWQREKKYSSLNEFLKNMPARNKIAVYNYSLSYPYRLNDYHTAGRREVPTAVRGSYILATYSGGEPIDMELFFERLAGSKKEITATMYNEKNQPVISQTVVEESSLRLRTSALPTGPYRLELKAEDTVITKRIITAQSKLAFVGRVWLTDANRKSITIYTDSQTLTAQTLNPASLQKISFANKTLDLSETYKQISLSFPENGRQARPVTINKDDITLSGDGVFAFSEADLLNASLRELRPGLDIDAAGIEYVIARYQPISEKGKRTVSFDLSGALQEKGRYSFMIAAPGLADIPDGLEVRAITAKLAGTSLLEYVKSWQSKL